MIRCHGLRSLGHSSRNLHPNFAMQTQRQQIAIFQRGIAIDWFGIY